MTKIDLITGFLGSGKTTFIREYVKYLLNNGLRICILENDFGAVNVDTMLVKDLMCDNLEIEMVAGGCDYDCHKRRFKTKLIAMGMKGYDRVIVEPSGIYDVDEFFDTLYDDPLDNWYEIGSVISLVDARMEYPLSDKMEKCLFQEISNAGIIIINNMEDCIINIEDKKNVNTDGIKNYLETGIKNLSQRQVNSDLYLFKDVTKLEEIEFERIINAGFFRGDYGKFNIEESGISSLYYMNLTYTTECWKKIIFQLFNDSDCGNIFRIKGFFKDNNKYYEVNATKSFVSINEIEDGQDVVIIIGENLSEQNINKYIK